MTLEHKSRTRRIWLAIGLGLLLLIGLLAGALRYVVDAGIFKERLETGASRALGMELRIGGALHLALRPGLALTLDDVHLHNRGVEVATAKQATLGVDALALLSGDVHVNRLALNEPQLHIERGTDGRFSTAPLDAAATLLPELSWPTVEISGGSFTYADKRWARSFEAVDCRIDMHGLHVPAAALSNLMKDVSFTADVVCGEVRHDTVKVSDLKFTTDAQHGVLELKSLTARAFDAEGTGRLRADFSGVVPSYRLDLAFKQLPIDEVFKALSAQPTAAGRVDFAAALSAQGQTENELRQALAGRVTLRGRNLTLKGRDLDEMLSRFESSQRFSLVDAGAFFFVGPLGLVLTKGLDFANVYRSQGGSSDIQTLVSDWKFERGVARAQDVAMATKKYRIALRGELDLVQQRFDGVSLALVDAQGCIEVQQRVSGSFQKPVVEEPNVLRSLAGPALSLLKKARELLPGSSCEVFYAGAVVAPA